MFLTRVQFFISSSLYRHDGISLHYIHTTIQEFVTGFILKCFSKKSLMLTKAAYI